MAPLSEDFQSIMRTADEMIACRSLLRAPDLDPYERAVVEVELAAHAETIWAYLNSLDL